MSEYLDPSAFTAGTIGPPGQRVFYLQAQNGSSVSSVRLEKQQVSALAEYLAGMLHDLPAPADVPPAPDLVEPVVPEWTVGNIGVAYDNELDRIIMKLRYGILDEELTLRDIGEMLDLSRERVRQIESKAVRKLQQPSRSAELIGFLD